MAFDFDFSLDKFKQAFPLCKKPENWFAAFQEVLPQYDINTLERVVAFLAQCGHESGNFNIIQENLNYSEQGLLKTFPKYFTQATASAYAKKPEKIANRVYANRMGNGDESSGEGYKFRGRGIVQITGKSNYSACSEALYGDNSLLDDPDLLLDYSNATHSACWYWEKTNLNALADKQDMKTITKKINGGYIGLDERIALYNKLSEVF